MAARKKTQEPDSVLRFKVKGVVYQIDGDSLEWGEGEILEDLLNAPLEDIDFRRMKAVRGLAYIAMRRQDPTVELDSLLHLKPSEFEEIGADEARPTAGEPETSGAPS